MNKSFTRREFLKQTSASGLALGSALAFPSIVRGQSLNEKLSVASIGTAGRAAANLSGVSSENIVALADVDSNSLDQASAKFASAKTYRDFRILLEKEGDNIDAVVVSTPDHTHAPAAAMALRMGKHVYCEKPMTHTVHEARVLQKLARDNGCVTQMGTQIHAGENYRRVVELIQTGAIGTVREVHVWVNVSHSYSGGRFTSNTPAPPNLDWDLWQGPAPWRPYSEGVHPFTWRQFWDYGNGRLGDFGCHYMDLVHWALDLKQPNKVAARGPEPDPVSTPEWLVVDYDYPARRDLPPVRMTWHGGRVPEMLNDLKDAEGKPLDWSSGQLFVGSKGMLLSNYGKHMLLPVERFVDFKKPDPYIPQSRGHHEEWIHAIKTGGKTTCAFDYSGPLTEAVLLGGVSFRSGESFEYDAKTGKVLNAPKAGALLHKEYREGWTL